MTILNSNIMYGLVRADSFGKMQQLATNEYYEALRKRDEGAMERSQGYAVSSMEDAHSTLEDVEKALEESVIAASSEIKSETTKDNEVKASASDEAAVSNTDTVEISLFAQNEADFAPTPVPEIPTAQSIPIGEAINIMA